MTIDEDAPDLTWRLILAAQQNDEVTSYFMRQLMGENQTAVDPDECHPEFKVLAAQMKHLSVAEEENSEVPKGLLFYKRSRIVAPPSIRNKLMAEAHGTGHTGITKTYNRLRSIWWWPAMYSDVKTMVDQCQVCLMTWSTNLHELTHHPLETTHAPREIAYLDIIGPVTGIASEHKFVVTALDGFSRYLATRTIPNKRAQTVAHAQLDIFQREMSVPARVIVDHGAEFVSTDTRAVLEKSLGVNMTFIPAGEHQQNLVERPTGHSGPSYGRSGLQQTR